MRQIQITKTDFSLIYIWQIFEKVIYTRMMHFINDKNILFSSQYGFREGFSTEQAIADVVSAIQSNMDKRLFTRGIFTDLKKAFDAVKHHILLNKFNRDLI